MTKLEFLSALREALTELSSEEHEERLNFYAEMIEDRVEEGITEEEAVAAVGRIDEIVAQTTVEPSKTSAERSKAKRRMTVGEIVLLILGSPIWISLGIVVLAVLVSLYVSLWAVILSLWAVFASVAACSVGGMLSCVVFLHGGKVASGVAMLAAGLVCAGLSIFLFYGCKAALQGILLFTKRSGKWIKRRRVS